MSNGNWLWRLATKLWIATRRRISGRTNGRKPSQSFKLDEKVIIFKKKRRKNYRRTTGHRQELTRLRILEVKGIISMETASPTPARKAKAISSRADSETEGCPTPVLA